ncbi:hypothetical protein, partial [Bordetella pertussis]|uniref:hypothetical protein n=1 Tax=Bordetella pertussis TaxID=520 RepID=UPI000B2DA6A8
AWSPRDAFRALAWHLLDFHRREQKPAWWETKLRTGARCTDVRTGASLANLVVDPHARLASFTCSARKP